MQFELSQALGVLERTPGVLRAMLAGLGPEWTHGDYGEGTFSPYDVVGHLITGERTNWMVRARLILESGTERAFTTFDRYAHFEESRNKSLDQLLSEFEQLRSANLAALRALRLTPQELARRGRHSDLGDVTLAQLLATWTVHDLNHLAQIARALAAQYEQAVGPWRDYLGIFKGPITRMDAEGAARRRAAR